MARIRTQKSFSELLKETNPNEFLPLMAKYKATDEKGNYLHWDKFKWKVEKTDPEVAAWVATKMARNSMLKFLPTLQAEDDKFFSYCIPDSLFAKLHHIDKVTGGGHALGDSTFITSREKDKYLVKNLMMEEAITSSQLEGASTTRRVAKVMLATDRKPTNKSEQMIFNNYVLMKKAVEKKDQDLSIDLLLELHAIATYKAIENDAIPGELRADNNISIRNIYNEVAFEPPCHTSIRERLEAVCDFANTEIEITNTDKFIHPIIKAIILHFMIAFIHPFGDGNGRTARALFYWSMLKSGYWLFEYVSISKLIQESRTSYDTAFIYTETDEFDLTYFLYNQLDVVIKAVNSLQTHIENKKTEFYNFMNWVEQSPTAKQLKRGQLEILKEALKQPGKTFTSKQIAIELDINENTARSYLNTLTDLELLIASKKKSEKTIIYIAPANIRDNLKI